MTGQRAQQKPGNFSREPRSLSPCRNFLKSRSRYSKEDHAQYHSGTSSREPRSRSPCRNFIKGRSSHTGSYEIRDDHAQKQPGKSARESRSRSSCRNFLKGRSRHRASCRNGDDHAQDQPGKSPRESKSRSPGRLKGRSRYRASYRIRDDHAQHQPGKSPREPRNRSTCCNFRKGRSSYRASCGIGDDHAQQQPDKSPRESRSQSPCRSFLKGRSSYRASSRIRHDHVQQQPGISAASRRPVSSQNAKERHELVSASRNRGFCEGNVDSILRSSDGHDGGYKENSRQARSFSREPRSRSPFLRGRYSYGATSRNRQDQSAHQQHPHQQPASFNETLDMSSPEHDEANQHNDMMPAPFLKDFRKGSYCQYFLEGRCYWGTSCKDPHPVTVDARTMYDDGTNQGVPASSRSHHFDEANARRGVKRNIIHSVNDVAVNDHLKERPVEEPKTSSSCQFFLKGTCHRGTSCELLHPVTVYGKTKYDEGTPNLHRGVKTDIKEWPMEKQFGRKRINMTGTPSDRSLDGHRHGSAGDLCGDKKIPEFCLEFSKGKCNRGESCKYLHSYHEYACSISRKSEKLHLEASADLMNIGFPTVAAQEDNIAKNDEVLSSEGRHTDSSLDSTDDAVLRLTSLGSETPDRTQGKPCEVCGKIGYIEAIVICCICKITCEHLYCMRIAHKGDPKEWMCEDCEPANQISPSKLGSSSNCEPAIEISPSKLGSSFNCEPAIEISPSKLGSSFNCEPADQISPSKLDRDTPDSLLWKIPDFDAEKDGTKSGYASVQAVHPLPAGGLGSDVQANAQSQNSDPEGSFCISRTHSVKTETPGSNEPSFSLKTSCLPDLLEFQRELESSFDRFSRLLRSGTSPFVEVDIKQEPVSGLGAT